jgi:acyl carrier protein
MNDTEILDTITPIFRAALGTEDLVLRPEMTAKDIPKWDSFRYVDIILRIEEALNIKIRPREANKVKSIGDIIALIQSKQAA